MEKQTTEQLKVLLARSGLQPSPEDIERTRDLYERFAPKLKLLDSPEVEGEEVAGLFMPNWPPQGARR